MGGAIAATTGQPSLHRCPGDAEVVRGHTVLLYRAFQNNRENFSEKIFCFPLAKLEELKRHKDMKGRPPSSKFGASLHSRKCETPMELGHGRKWTSRLYFLGCRALALMPCRAGASSGFSA